MPDARQPVKTNECYDCIWWSQNGIPAHGTCSYMLPYWAMPENGLRDGRRITMGCNGGNCMAFTRREPQS